MNSVFLKDVSTGKVVFETLLHILSIFPNIPEYFFQLYDLSG